MIQKPSIKALLRQISTLCYILIFSVGSLLGQEAGSISGRVTDDRTGDPLPGVNIQVQNTRMGAMTDLDGNYVISGPVPGYYSLKFTMMGYAPVTKDSLAITMGQRTALDVSLKVNVIASPQVVVTSSRKDQDILESPFSVSAIGSREIQAKAVIEMADILAYEPGVNVVKGQLNIRGASGYTLGAGSRSLLLVDGIPLLGSAAGNISWGNIPTSEVDRVEIVKSGGSAMYGSSAMGGVVNIITRNAAPEPETRVAVQSGVYSQPRFEQWQWRDSPGLLYNTEISHSRRIGQHAGWVRLQKRRDDGLGELNWTDALTLTGKLKLNFGTAHTASVFLNIFQDKAGLLSTWKSPADPFEAPVGSEDDYTSGVKTILNSEYGYLHSPDLSFKLRGSHYSNNWEGFGADPDYSNERREFGEVLTNWSLNSALSLVGGVSLQGNQVEAQIFGEHDSRSLSTYLLAQQRYRRTTFSLGGRWEAYSVDGVSRDELFSPQVAWNWKPHPAMALRASMGKGFRVPTVAEMFTRARRSIFYVEPNPDLISETSLSQEFGLSVMGGQLGIVDLVNVDAAVFQNLFENLIEPVPDSLAIIHFENIADARITGAELGLGVSVLDNLMDLKTSYTWLDPVELDDDKNVIDTLSYRYRHHWVSTIGFHLSGVDANLEYRYASALESVELFPENGVTGQDRQVPIHVWNASLGGRVAGVEVLFRVENIFQYYYTQLERNMAEERVFQLSVEYTL